MKTNILNLDNKKIKDIDLNDKIFGIKILPDLIHQYLRYQNAKSRQGSHKTKNRVRSEEQRLNSSHTVISYAVFCLKKKKKNNISKHHQKKKNINLLT